MTVKFTVDHDHTYEGEDGEEQLVGWIHFEVTAKAGDFRSGVSGSNPKTIKLPRRSAWLAADGHLYKDATSGLPFRLVANDPEFNLDHLTYKVTFELTTLLGDPVSIQHTFFPAPSTDTTVYVTRFIRDPDQTVMEVLSKAYAADILDASEFGRALLRATSPGDAGAVSDFDFRLDDTRTPTDGSVTLDKLVSELAAALQFFSEAQTPGVLRIGRTLDDSVQATQVEVWSTGSGDESSRALFIGNAGVFLLKNLRVGSDADAEQRVVRINTAAGQFRWLQFESGGLPRWLIGATNAAESGGDAGSNLQVVSRHDDGSAKTVVLSVSRATDVLTLGGELVTKASTTSLAGVNFPAGTAPTSPVDGDVWATTAAFFARINGVTQQFITGGDVASAATASKVAQRDSNGNLFADVFVPSETSTVTAAGTTTLAIDSTQVQVFTGSTTQTVKLPTTSVTAGMSWIVCNQSSGTVTVQSSGANTITTVRAGKVGVFTAQKDAPTAAADWTGLSPNIGAASGSIVERDSSGKITCLAFLTASDSTTTAAGTTTLSSSSSSAQIFTGSTTQTVKLPSSGINAGNEYTVVNQSSGTVTVQSSGANTIATVAGGAITKFVALVSSPTTAADWKRWEAA